MIRIRHLLQFSEINSIYAQVRKNIYPPKFVTKYLYSFMFSVKTPQPSSEYDN